MILNENNFILHVCTTSKRFAKKEKKRKKPLHLYCSENNVNKY